MHKAEYEVLFSAPRPEAGKEVVSEITFRFAFHEGDLAGLELELVGARLCRNSSGALYVTWPARTYGERTGKRRYWNFVQGADGPEARNRLIQMFESTQQG